MTINQDKVIAVLTQQGKNVSVVNTGQLWVQDFGPSGGSQNGFFVDSHKVAIDNVPISNKVFWGIVDGFISK